MTVVVFSEFQCPFCKRVTATLDVSGAQPVQSFEEVIDLAVGRP